MAGYYGDEGYDYYGPPQPRNRRLSPHQIRSDYRGAFLAPGFDGGLHRSRSTGHGPSPTVNIRMYQDNVNRSPSPMPMPGMPYAVPYPTSSSRHASPRASPEGRGRGRSRSGLGDRLGDELTAELADMALEHRYRSRSRGRSDASGFDRPPQYALAEYQLRELSREKQRRLEEESIRRKIQLEQYQKERDEEEREAREKRLIADAQRKAELDREKKEASDKALLAEHERKQWEKEQQRKEEEARMKEKFERDAREAKEKEARQIAEWKRKEKEAEEEEKRKEAEYERKRLEKLAAEKKKKEEAESAFQDEMRKRLRTLGYTEQTIEIMVDEEKQKAFAKQVNERPARSPARGAHVSWEPPTRAPIYPKIRKEYLEIKTLEYYDLPWHYDHTNPDYIIIRQDLDKAATDVLFEHTRSIRNRGSFLLEPKKEKQFAMYRRRSKSRHGAKEIGVVRLGR